MQLHADEAGGAHSLRLDSSGIVPPAGSGCEQEHSCDSHCQAVTLRDWTAIGISVSEWAMLRHAVQPPHIRERRDRRRELRRSPPETQTVTHDLFFNLSFDRDTSSLHTTQFESWQHIHQHSNTCLDPNREVRDHYSKNTTMQIWYECKQCYAKKPNLSLFAGKPWQKCNTVCDLQSFGSLTVPSDSDTQIMASRDSTL